jgi:hypothetical protein
MRPVRHFLTAFPPFCAAGLCALALLGPSRAAGPLPSPSAPDAPTTADCRRTVRVREAIARDPVLAPYNIGVTVRDGVVRLWGLVPSAALAQRAAEQVRHVQGVLEVRNEIHIVPPDDSLVEFLPQPAAPLPPPAAALTGRPVPTPTAPLVPIPSWPVMPAITIPPRPPAVVSPSLAQWSSSPSVDLAQAVEQLRQTDARYRWLRTEVVNGVVRLSGFVPRREDAFVLAQAVARVPGVQRVVVEHLHPVPVRPGRTSSP